MQFDDWMRSQSLSEASISKYYIAVKGVLSDWAQDAGIIERSLLDIRNAAEFSNVVLKIKELPIFKSRDSAGNQMYSAALKKYAQYLYHNSQPSIEADIEAILVDQNTKATDKVRLVNARIGQGKYRKDLIDLWQGRCCITSYSEISMLLASHIKPWSQCSNAERLDKYNGLLLLPNLDKAFDSGLISFEETGEIRISSHLKEPALLGINKNMRIDLKQEHIPYLSYHNENIFRDA